MIGPVIPDPSVLSLVNKKPGCETSEPHLPGSVHQPEGVGLAIWCRNSRAVWEPSWHGNPWLSLANSMGRRAVGSIVISFRRTAM